MVIKYTRLLAEASPNLENLVKWTKNQVPVAFLRQQVFLVSLVIGSTLLLLFTTFFTTDIEYELIQSISSDFKYGVVVDCGSSGSRAHIFRWKPDSLMMNHIELVRDSSSGIPLNKHITPGLSSFRDEPERASDYLEPIMSFISESIPQDKHLDTSIYFMATAGLRLLEESIQKRILSDISRDLKAKFGFPRIKSQVISGTLEGVYSWLSLNMNKKNRNQEKNSNISKSYGMIEMGGASTQVAFELDPEIENAILKELKNTDAITAFKNEQVVLNLGPNESVKLFATTFLGLGANSGREATIDLLVQEYLNGTGELNNLRRSEFTDYEIRLKDPCLTTGSSEIVMRPVSLLKNSNRAIGSSMKQGESTFKVRLEGSGDFLACMDSLTRVLNKIKSEKLNCNISKNSNPSCPMSLLGTNFIPYQRYAFVGLSEMFFTTNEMMELAGNFNRSRVLHETQRICSTQYNSLLEMYSKNGRVSFEDRILYECFKASWLVTLLHDYGFKMPVDYDNFSTLNRLNDVEIDWTIGAMLAEVALNKVNSHII